MGPATEDDSMADATHVLVPTLGRPREDEALTYALETFPDAEITLLAVVTPLDAPLSEGGVLERSEERTTAARASAEEVLESVTDSTDPAVVDRVRIETTEDGPAPSSRSTHPRRESTTSSSTAPKADRRGFSGGFSAAASPPRWSNAPRDR